jgi:hypothetical protein
VTSDTNAKATSERREIYLDRRICLITPGRIDIHPARSIIFLPIFTLLLGLAAFPVIFFLGDSLSIPVRLLLTLGAIVLVPVSGLGIVYSVAGAHLVIDATKQSAVLQQGYLGMGVGTQELVPFWKFDKVVVQELTPHDYRGHHEDFVQYEIYILKLSGRQVSVGMITTARVDADVARERAIEVARIIADMAGSEVYEPEIKEGPYWPEQIESAPAASASPTGAPDNHEAPKPARTYKRIEKSKA